MKKNIAIFIPTIKSGGAEKQAVLLAKTLSTTCIVHFVVFYGAQHASQQHIEQLHTSAVVLHLLQGNWWHRLYVFRSVLKENSIEIVFNYLTNCNVLGSIVERTAGIKTIYNGIRNSRLPALKYIAEKLCHNHIAKGSIFNCYSGADYFSRKGFNKQKCIVITNCFPNIVPVFHRHERPIKTIITVGRFVKQKDYLTAIKTISLLKDRTDIKFYIVGYGKLESQIRHWIKKYHIEAITTVFINPPNVPDLLRNADIYLSTSLFEGTSNSIMEAMSWSLPVVCTNVGDNTHLVINRQNGFIHSIGDSKGMATSISLLLNDLRLRNNYGESGNVKLCKDYSESKFTEAYNELIVD